MENRTAREVLSDLQRDDTIRFFKESRARLDQQDRYRPRYHLSTPIGSMNDPNGLCFWKGGYHLFFQYVPVHVSREGVHWGHFYSENLTTWHDLPIAFAPDRENSCYSGQICVEEDRVVAMYHGKGLGNCIAIASDPLLLNWERPEPYPAIPNGEPDANGSPYRVFDPCIWRESDGYYALSGTYKNGTVPVIVANQEFTNSPVYTFKGSGRAVNHLFYSKDLSSWSYLHPLLEDGFFSEPGEDGAVPNFFPLGKDKHMLLLFSHKRAARYYVGDYDQKEHRFYPDYHGRFNNGPWRVGSVHAPSGTPLSDGSALAVFNMKDGMKQDEWVGLMTLPLHLGLDSDNSLSIKPASGLKNLRKEVAKIAPQSIPSGEEVAVPGAAGRSIEIEIEIDPGTSRESGIYVLRSPDGSERTRISIYNNAPFDQHRYFSFVQIDSAESSSLKGVYARPPETAPVKLRGGEPLKLNIFIDQSIVEIFAGGQQYLAQRVYPGRDDSTGLSLFSRGGDARVLSMKVWQMGRIFD